MPTYQAIKGEVRITSCFVPKTCWIAHVLEPFGKELRSASNRVDANVRKYPCPAEKQAAIIDAISRLEKQALRPRGSSL